MQTLNSWTSSLSVVWQCAIQHIVLDLVFSTETSSHGLSGALESLDRHPGDTMAALRTPIASRMPYNGAGKLPSHDVRVLEHGGHIVRYIQTRHLVRLKAGTLGSRNVSTYWYASHQVSRLSGNQGLVRPIR